MIASAACRSGSVRYASAATSAAGDLRSGIRMATIVVKRVGQIEPELGRAPSRGKPVQRLGVDHDPVHVEQHRTATVVPHRLLSRGDGPTAFSHVARQSAGSIGRDR